MIRRPGITTYESTPAETKIPTISTSFSMQSTTSVRARKMAVSRQGGNGVGPCLDECTDGVVRIGGDPDLVPAERDVVHLAVRVVALQGARVGLGLGVTGRVSAHGGGYNSIPKIVSTMITTLACIRLEEK